MRNKVSCTVKRKDRKKLLVGRNQFVRLQKSTNVKKNGEEKNRIGLKGRNQTLIILNKLENYVKPFKNF